MMRDLPDDVTERREARHKGLLSSRSFWVGGLVSLAVWVALGLLAYWLIA